MSGLWNVGGGTMFTVSLRHMLLAICIGSNRTTPDITGNILTGHVQSAWTADCLSEKAVPFRTSSTCGIMVRPYPVSESECSPYGDTYWDDGGGLGIKSTVSIFWTGASWASAQP